MAASNNSSFAVLPQYQGDYLDVQRKQALAQALMGVAVQNGGDQLNARGAGMRVMPRYGIGQGLTQLGQAYLAAKLGNEANQGMRDLSANQMQFLMGAPSTPAAPASDTSSLPAALEQQQSVPLSMGVGADGGFTGSVDHKRSMLLAAMAGEKPAQSAQAPQQQGGFLQPGAPNNPAGLPVQMAAQLYLSDPGKYWEVQAAQFKPADITAQIRAAGIDPTSQLGRQIAQQSVAKANYIAPTAFSGGGYVNNPMTGQMEQLPQVPEGFTAQRTPDGQWAIVPAQGGPGAVESSARATAAGRAAVTPIQGYQNGAPVFTNQLAAATGGGGGGGAPVNTGRFGGYSAPAGGAVTPGLAPGVAEAAGVQANQNAKRSGSLVDSAAESPMRVNVLDNVLALSQGGVATGPTAEWKNKVKGVFADTIGPESWKDDVSGFQEMKKFLKQNGLRAWSAAGGSGTDSQLNAAMEANPNDKMFPHAVRTMAQWAKAGELALQSKATAQDAWLARNQNNPAAQNQFESVWRQNYDPRIYQMKLMDPSELQAFVAKIPQSERATLMQKYSTAKQNGWIQ